MKIVRVRTSSGTEESGALLEDGRIVALEGGVFENPKPSSHTLDAARTLAPVLPPNIFCIGANYKKHIEESNAKVPSAPAIFLKPTTALNDPSSPICLPPHAADEVDYEAELAIVIGKTARNVSRGQALEYVLGYCCANDVSARDCQLRHDLQWARGKSFDTFCPIGPYIETDIQPSGLRIRSFLNGKTMQDSSTGDMLFPPDEIVSYLSHQFTLLPGTLILTGTPEGVGMAQKPPAFLRPGDTIEVEIEGLGRLSNPVAASA